MWSDSYGFKVFKRKKIQPHKYKKDASACCEGLKRNEICRILTSSIPLRNCTKPEEQQAAWASAATHGPFKQELDHPGLHWRLWSWRPLR